MINFKIFAYAFVWMFLISFVNAAIIHGAIYDLSLKKVNNARVEINTTPNQFLVAQNGSYEFNVPSGAYTIKAQLMQKNTALAVVQENITTNQDGSYVLDLILFPDIEEGVEEIDIDVNGDIIESKSNKDRLLIGFFIMLILLSILIAIYYAKKIKNTTKIEDKKTEGKYEGDSLEEIMQIIKKEGGRVTQKDIRKQIPLSEAKISLMIAELEHNGIIEKIKKGRGNIIILKKK